jgi:hypothetical protein
MLKKPQDLLEFFRRSSGDRPEAAAPQDLEKTPRMLVVRRSQAVVAAVSAGLGLVLAFLLGLGLGGASSDPAVAGGGLWVIKVVSYEDNDKGRRYTKTVMSQLERLDLGDEVNLSRVVSDGKLAASRTRSALRQCGFLAYREVNDVGPQESEVEGQPPAGAQRPAARRAHRAHESARGVEKRTLDLRSAQDARGHVDKLAKAAVHGLQEPLADSR